MLLWVRISSSISGLSSSHNIKHVGIHKMVIRFFYNYNYIDVVTLILEVTFYLYFFLWFNYVCCLTFSYCLIMFVVMQQMPRGCSVLDSTTDLTGLQILKQNPQHVSSGMSTSFLYLLICLLRMCMRRSKPVLLQMIVTPMT